MGEIFSGISQSVYNAVEPIAQQYGVPDEVWETVVLMESGGNPTVQNGSTKATGLFQLMPNGGQADNAIRDGYTLDQLKDPALNAKYGMPQIGAAVKALGPFDGSYPWWQKFATLSGHPYENGQTNDYSMQLGADMASLWASKKPFGVSVTNDAKTTAGNVISGVQSGIDGVTTISNFIQMLMGGGFVKIGLFLLSLIVVVVGFLVISKQQGVPA